MKKRMESRPISAGTFFVIGNFVAEILFGEPLTICGKKCIIPIVVFIIVLFD